jgi:hypothetical protein
VHSNLARYSQNPSTPTFFDHFIVAKSQQFCLFAKLRSSPFILLVFFFHFHNAFPTYRLFYLVYVFCYASPVYHQHVFYFTVTGLCLVSNLFLFYPRLTILLQSSCQCTTCVLWRCVRYFIVRCLTTVLFKILFCPKRFMCAPTPVISVAFW